MAIGKSVEFLSDSFNIMQILIFFILAPTIVQMAKKSHFKFSHPWLCILISMALYASFFFAHSYAMGTRGPGRVQNIYSYIHLWLIGINMYYLSGAIIRKAENKAPLSSVIVELITISKKNIQTHCIMHPTLSLRYWYYLSPSKKQPPTGLYL